jgi:hypothetical protein
MAFPQATLHRVSFPLFQFRRQQRFQITQMILALPHRLFSQAYTLRRHRRHPQQLALLLNRGFL